MNILNQIEALFCAIVNKKLLSSTFEVTYSFEVV